MEPSNSTSTARHPAAPLPHDVVDAGRVPAGGHDAGGDHLLGAHGAGFGFDVERLAAEGGEKLLT